MSSGQISFLKNRLNRGRDMVIYIFSRRRLYRHLHLSIFKRSERSRERNCITMPNFVQMASTVAEISRFFDISRWRPPPSWIFKIKFFRGSLYQISSKLLEPRPRYRGGWRLYRRPGPLTRYVAYRRPIVTDSMIQSHNWNYWHR